MKIKQIRKTGPELYLVTYSWFLTKNTERYVISRKTKGILQPVEYDFRFRDTGFRVDATEGRWSLEWMIRNKIDFFDNTKSPDPMWPRGDRKTSTAASLQRCEKCGEFHEISEYCKGTSETKLNRI